MFPPKKEGTETVPPVLSEIGAAKTPVLHFISDTDPSGGHYKDIKNRFYTFSILDRNYTIFKSISQIIRLLYYLYIYS